MNRTVKTESAAGIISRQRPIAITTDNASNIVKGVESAGFQHHTRCFAHCLNLAALKALQINTVFRLLGQNEKNCYHFPFKLNGNNNPSR